MPGPFKKPRAVFPVEDQAPEESDEEMEQDEMIGKNVNVDFEGFPATDADFHGIKRLLQQCFRGLQVDVSGLTDTIISQNYVGSVLKQVDAEEDDDEEEEMGDDDEQQVFGVTTVINLTARKDEECVAGLRTALVERCSGSGPDTATALLRDILGNESKHVGLLLSERLVNLPPQFAIPVFDCLRKEINEAKKKMPYDFAYLLLISKVYKLEKKKKKTVETELWGNPEEEVIAEECMASFEYSVKGDSTMSGEWDEDDPQYAPFRRVLILEAARLPEIIAKVKQAVQQ